MSIFNKISKVLKRKSCNENDTKRFPIYEKPIKKETFIDTFVDTYYSSNKHLSYNSFFYPKIVLQYKKKLEETGLILSTENETEIDDERNKHLDDKHLDDKDLDNVMNNIEYNVNFEKIESDKRRAIEDFHLNLYKIQLNENEFECEGDDEYIYRIRSPSIYSEKCDFE